MKKPLIVGLALSTLCASALAQSRVTLYGVIDEGILYQSNVAGGKKVSLESLTGLFGSRWGLTGVEDLGGGLHAIFTLESGINLNNGQFAQGGTAFGRQAFVGLSHDRFGNLTFGRQYDMIFYFPEFLTPEALVGTSVAGHPGDIDNAYNTVRINNAIRYMSRDFNGFTFGGEYSVGGIAGNATVNSGYSVGASYKNGGLAIAAAFEYFKQPTSTAGSGFFTAYANGASPLAASLNKAYATARAYQSAVIAGNYTIGPVTLGASYSNVQYANLGPTFATSTARFNDIDVGARYQFNPYLSFAGSYNYLAGAGVTTATGNVVGNQHYHQVALLTNYALSKRTNVYIGASWQRASGTSSLGTPAVADINNMGDSSNNHQFMIRAGLLHRF
ncbi:porin [Burkholderia pseudomultivorans]|uniref:Porin n=1 Tax=Burkholderia pseudomultivorans TaxID=1207504 RepID=A0A132E847_9BURK|nr:porin [Burkholderia pseudomultivorans]KWF20560.1 porin [Burkholderia pseudomultivorans]